MMMTSSSPSCPSSSPSKVHMDGDLLLSLALAKQWSELLTELNEFQNEPKEDLTEEKETSSSSCQEEEGEREERRDASSSSSSSSQSSDSTESPLFITEVETGNTIAHLAAMDGSIEVLKLLLSLTKEKQDEKGEKNKPDLKREEQEEKNTRPHASSVKTFPISELLRKKNSSNRSPLSTCEGEITRLERKLEEKSSRPRKAEEVFKLEKKLKALREARKWLLQNAYSPVERLFYGEGTFEEMYEEFAHNVDALREGLEFYNGVPYPFLCVEENDRRKIRWIALQKFSSEENLNSSTSTVKEGGKPSQTRAAISSPLELRDNQGNTLLHLVHFEVDVGDEEEEDVEEEGSDYEDEEESALHKRKQRELSSKKNKNSQCRNQREDGEPSSCEKTDTPWPSEVDVSEDEEEVLSSITPTAVKALTESDKDTLKTLRCLLRYPQVRRLINEKNDYGETPSHYIVADAPSGDAAMAALVILVRSGADLNIQDLQGRTVLMAFCEAHGDGPWVKWCLTPKKEGGGGADENMKDLEGRKLEYYIKMGEDGDSDDDDEEDDDEWQDEEDEEDATDEKS
ncbi:hypothetical protein CSUI_005552 [Cystoisospora suis]|uniref:Ankyrin repeat-containing protein n=1 Tax=Cystoisospora suis TaxID=483139 RepID=A0A2C6KWM6_9APIC|nr:hypothetical protein CSUI_005552 [Cystoisospora suis]